MKETIVQTNAIAIPKNWHTCALPADGSLFLIRNPAWPAVIVAYVDEAGEVNFTDVTFFIGEEAPTQEQRQALRDSIPESDPDECEWTPLRIRDPDLAEAIHRHIFERPS